MTNIPLYRAKRLDNDEYIKGFYFEEFRPKTNPTSKADIEDSSKHIKKYYIRNSKYVLNTYEIDPSTLAIHFPDMLDKNNNPIFASLSEDGRGGDSIFYRIGGRDCVSVARYTNRSFDYIDRCVEVTGIYEGDK